MFEIQYFVLDTVCTQYTDTICFGKPRYPKESKSNHLNPPNDMRDIDKAKYRKRKSNKRNNHTDAANAEDDVSLEFLRGGVVRTFGELEQRVVSQNTEEANSG
jgi:hypothetical protein